MKRPSRPYSLPRKLERELDRVYAYWEGLKRGNADMPFCDDVNLSALPDVLGKLMLINILETPARFRFDAMIGDEIKNKVGKGYAGKFLDEIEVHPPFEYLNSQSSATVEGRLPTYYRRSFERDTQNNYARLVLPMWGEGHINMLVAAFHWE